LVRFKNKKLAMTYFQMGELEKEKALLFPSERLLGYA